MTDEERLLRLTKLSLRILLALAEVGKLQSTCNSVRTSGTRRLGEQLQEGNHEFHVFGQAGDAVLCRHSLANVQFWILSSPNVKVRMSSRKEQHRPPIAHGICRPIILSSAMHAWLQLQRNNVATFTTTYVATHIGSGRRMSLLVERGVV